MKTLHKIYSSIRLYPVFLAMILLSLSLDSCSRVYYNGASPENGNVTFQMFYDNLDPYGQWVDYSPYGYVWIPDAGPDFFPYLTNGYWVSTQFGWAWRSGYSWGWAPFHYGRWDFDNYYGWFWVPDNVWGPCWVTWRRADGYFGWAPLRPGISIDISFRGEYRDINRWRFISERDFVRHNLTHYYLNRSDYDRLISSSRVITNTYADQGRNVTYVSGPRWDDVQRITGRRITVVNVRDYDRPGERLNGRELQIYRPQIENVTGRTEIPAPHKVTDLNEIRRSGGSNSTLERNSVQPGKSNRSQNTQINKNERPGRETQQINNNNKEQQQRNATPHSRVRKAERANRRNINEK